jgi:integrase/recombinase XerD
MGKNNRERYVIMSPKIQQQIEDYIYCYRDLYMEEISSHVNPDSFFIGVGGTPLTKNTLSSRLRKLWSLVKNTYGSDKHIALHTLRHTLGTHLYMAKMDIEMIALMLGHRSLNVTQVYIHLTNLLQNEQI